jgi:hypothetical protein
VICPNGTRVYVGDSWTHATCCLTGSHDGLHRWQGSSGDVAVVVEWGNDRKRVGVAELNGLRPVLAAVREAPDEEIALALLGYLADRPGVARLLLADLPAVVG